MINLKPQVLGALQADDKLINLLGGLRIYQLRAPVATEFPRITFFEYENIGATYADDTEQDSEIYIQIDIWCRDSSTSEIAKRVDITMKSIGFQRQASQDLYEDDNDTEIYHKAMRYSITIDCGEE